MSVQLLRFDNFELDFEEGQLRRRGTPVKMENIPLRLLLLLAEKNGQLISREEITEKLWGKNVFLDAEQGVNTAIRKIRLALKDHPNKQEYVQTVVGRGYRFLATPIVEEQNIVLSPQPHLSLVPNGNIRPLELPSIDPPPVRWFPPQRDFRWAFALVLVLAGFSLATLGWAVHRSSQQSAAAMRQVAELSRNVSSSEPNFGLMSATLPIEKVAGKHVRYTGYIKTKDISNGWAGLWWRVDGASGMISLDNMQGRGVTATADWKWCEIELTVPKDATKINFGGLLTGDGSAWFDDLQIEIDGVRYNSNAFDLGFDSPGTKSMYLGGTGYRVQLDNRVFRSGGQSLSMAHVPPSVD